MTRPTISAPDDQRRPDIAYVAELGPLGAYESPGLRFYVTPPVDGALCECVTIGAALAHPGPDSVSDEAAVLCEPLSTGIAAVRRAGVASGSRVLVAGAGPIGVTIDAMVTARFPLDKVAEAFESDRTPGSIKAVIEMDDR